MGYVCMAQVTEGGCQKGVEGVDTLQAAEPPCSVRIAIHYFENKFTVPIFRKLVFEKVSIFVVWLGPFAK